jgi:hypothetical protein
MVLIKILVINGMIDIAIGHQNGFISELIKGQAQATSRPEYSAFLLHYYAGNTLKGVNYLLAKIMAVDNDMVTTGLLQTLNREQQQGLIQDGKEGFRADKGIRQEAGSESRCQNHSLHQKKNEKKGKRRRAI